MIDAMFNLDGAEMKDLTLALVFLASTTTAIADNRPLWEIGKADGNTAKFALGPNNYAAYRQPGFFIIGQSDPKKDWPYVQPGIIDGGWAPGRPQTFEIVFAVAAAPQQACRLDLHFADTHSTHPPRLRVEVNGLSGEYQTPKGGGDASVLGKPSKGRRHVIRMGVPPGTLKAGTNRIAVTTLTGSWVLWDAVRFEATEGLKLAAVRDFASVTASTSAGVLERHEGKPAHRVTVNIVRTGKPAAAVVRVGDQQPVNVHLTAGRQTLEAFVPPVERPETIPITLSIGPQVMAEAKIEIQPVRKWDVYVLMHSHNDIGYTDIQPNIAKKQAHNVLRALELIRQTKDYPAGARFKWNLEVLMPYEDFHQISTPEQEKQFEQAVRDGDIGIDAMYANLLTGVCRGEELVRQFSFATALGRRCGVNVDSMMISDVPGMTWGVVPALAHNGVKYISNGPNANPKSMDGDRIGYVRVEWEHRPFYWLSPSGREKVLYWGAQGGYSIGHGYPSITAAIPPLLKRLTEVKYPYDIVQLRWTKGDNGPPDEAVMDLVRDWNAKHAWPRLTIATTTQAFHEFEKRYGDKLPTYRGDLTPYWEDGAGSGARETALNRHSADRLVQAETLWALRNPGPFPAADFAAAWKNVFLWSEHTWGAHNSVHQPDLPFVKTQWKYKQAYAMDADRQSRALLEKATGESRATPFDRVDVFNTTSWPRTGLMVVPKGISGDRMQDEQGKLLPVQYLSTGELVFLARDIPPFSARRYACVILSGGLDRWIINDNVKAAGATVKIPSLRVKLDETTGAIASLKQTGIAAEFAAGPVNSYINLSGGNVKDARPNGPAKITVKEKGPLVVSLVAESEAPGCKKLTREVQLIDGLDRVEIIDTVDKQPIRPVEGVHFGFAFNVPNPEVRVNSPGAVVRPEKDQIPGACKNWFSVERWVDVSNEKYGVTWVTADAPLMEMGGLTANLPRTQPNPNAYLKSIQPSATLYSWVMNNHWHTNYRADQEGPTTFRYYIRPHGTYDPVEAARFGVESTVPLIAVPAKGEKPVASRLRIETTRTHLAPRDERHHAERDEYGGVIATALKPSDDGKAIILRLWNVSGKMEQTRIMWADPQPLSVSLSNASEQPGEKVSGPIEVPAWGIVTVRAEMK